MRPRRRHVLLLCTFAYFGLMDAMEPISTSIAVGVAAALTGFLASYPNIFYLFHESCRCEWISFNQTGKPARVKLNAEPLSHEYLAKCFLANVSAKYNCWLPPSSEIHPNGIVC